MRSIFLFIALAVVFLSANAKAQTPQIFINDYLETTGQVIITVYVTNANNVGGFDFTVHYNNDALEFIQHQNLTITGGELLLNNTNTNEENTSRIAVSWLTFGVGAGASINGKLLEFVFMFSGDYSDFQFFNVEFVSDGIIPSPFPIDASNGSITYQQPVEVGLAELPAELPGTVNIPLLVDFSVVEAGVGAFDLLIEYDNNLLADASISDEELTGIVLTEPQTGQIRLQWDNPEPPGSQFEGQLLNLNFDFAGGDMSDLTFIHTACSITNQDGINLPISFADGFIDHARFDVTFSVNDGLGSAVTNATIVLGVLENPPGAYLFTDIFAGTYSYSVTAPGFSESTGTLVLDQDLNITVTIDDIEAPQIECPADLINIPADEGVQYAIIPNIGEPTVFDNHTPVEDLDVSNDAPGSNQYPIGTTIVVWTVTDAAGNTATCTQTITVVDDEAPVPPTKIIQNVTIHDDEETCFNATQTITTAGDNTYFIVEGGGSATLIAGESIRMLPGTVVEYGGYLHAYITLDDEYCGAPVAKLLDEPADVPLSEQIVPDMSGKEALFKVYPNPTTGILTLELFDQAADIMVNVAVYGLRGEIILSKDITPPVQQHVFNLENQLPGIYIIRVTAGNRTDQMRIIKR